MRRLNYVTLAGQVITSTVSTDMPLYEEWLWHLLDNHTFSDVIFFYTEETTDIWEDEPKEFEHNVVVSCGDNGVIYHTYSPRCPEGCHGQMQGCHYVVKQIASGVFDAGRIVAVSLDPEPGPHGGYVKVCTCSGGSSSGAGYHSLNCPLNKNNLKG